MISADGSDNTVDITLDTAPVDGQTVEIKAVDITHDITIIGTIDGETNYTFAAKYDALKIVYNADISEWEIR